FLQQLFSEIEADPKTEINVDLPKQIITITSNGASESFEINPYKKECLLNGYDDIDYLLSIRDKIETFEKQREY
ncbi:MAG: 3-isopropylmalate dehydratase small subunit, partial [Sphingobacteriales bacterium]